MEKLKSLRVLLTNFIICIGAGHGFGPIVLIEIFSLKSLLFDGEVDFNGGNLPSFSFNNSYEDMIMYFIICSFFGQILFIISWFKFFKPKIKFLFKFLGILFMSFGFFLISKNINNDNLAFFSIVTGIPFLCFVFLELIPLSTPKLFK